MKHLFTSLILAFGLSACAIDSAEQPEVAEDTSELQVDATTESAQIARHFELELAPAEVTCTKRKVSTTTQVDYTKCRHRSVTKWYWPCYGEYTYTYGAWVAGC